jgi:hypothetical protein
VCLCAFVGGDRDNCSVYEDWCARSLGRFRSMFMALVPATARISVCSYTGRSPSSLGMPEDRREVLRSASARVRCYSCLDCTRARCVAKSAPTCGAPVKARAKFRECYSFDERKLSRSLITLCIPTLGESAPALGGGPRGWPPARRLPLSLYMISTVKISGCKSRGGSARVPPLPVLSRAIFPLAS